MKRRLGTAVLTACLPALVAAQEPTGPPPPSHHSGDAGSLEHELLPDIGRLGAQVGIGVARSWNPYQAGQGIEGSGYIDLPLRRVSGGKLAYQIRVSLSESTSAPFTLTDPIAYVANLASGASPPDALAGPPRAPFPVRRSVRSHLRLLQVSPFGLKYTLQRLDHLRLRPYLDAGLDLSVAISSEVPERDESREFTGTAPFDDPLIGGLVSQAAELSARGQPTGQGNIAFGFHAGGGIGIRLRPGLSLNLDYRFSRVDERGRLHALGGALGFLF